MQDKILALIKDYITCAVYMCNAMRDNYAVNETLLRSRKINLIPKEGELPDNIYFNFHGGGCYFKFESGSIDIDFGPNDKCDGFDHDRLYDFLRQSKKDDYKVLYDKEIFKRGFDGLVSIGQIIKPEWYPNPHLYYLANTIHGT